MDDFQNRDGRHSQAMRMSLALWKHYGFVCEKTGVETDSEEMRELLRERTDPASMKLRWRSDGVLLSPDCRFHTPMLEVKSQQQEEYECFTMEADSLLAARLHANMGFEVVYNFVRLHSGVILACWLRELPEPAKVWVPLRPGWEQRFRRMRQHFPTSDVDTKPWRNGSGTPYVLVSRRTKCLRPGPQFIEEEILFTRKPRVPVQERLAL